MSLFAGLSVDLQIRRIGLDVKAVVISIEKLEKAVMSVLKDDPDSVGRLASLTKREDETGILRYTV